LGRGIALWQLAARCLLRFEDLQPLRERAILFVKRLDPKLQFSNVILGGGGGQGRHAQRKTWQYALGT
jgi:hypothetical protein